MDAFTVAAINSLNLHSEVAEFVKKKMEERTVAAGDLKKGEYFIYMNHLCIVTGTSSGNVKRCTDMQRGTILLLTPEKRVRPARNMKFMHS